MRIFSTPLSPLYVRGDRGAKKTPIAKLKRENVDNEYTANSVHYEIGKIVRKAIKEAGGTMPEDLPTPNKSLKELEKENKNNIKLQNVCKDLEKYT